MAHDGTATGIAICFMLKTGLRRAELLGLKYSDLSKSGTYLSINRQYVFDFEFDKNGKPTKKISHLVERTTLRNYCYNRYNKTQTEDMLEKALS